MYAFDLHTVFELPVLEQCAHLSSIIANAPVKDLEFIFPRIISNVFGNNTKTCWNLRSVKKTTVEFREITNFLHPNGPMFMLCYNLFSNSDLKFEFPFQYLSETIQRQLDGTLRNSYYMKGNYKQKNREKNLSLNALEYYFFNFAFHLVNPSVSVPPIRDSAVSNTAYCHLVQVYLHHFLPCKSSLVYPPLTYRDDSSPSRRHEDLDTSKRFRIPSSPLICGEAVAKMCSYGNTVHNKSTYSSKIWRSELIVRLFIDYWLVTENEYSKNQLLPNLFYIQSLPACSQHIMCIRMLIKHLHVFSNQATSDDYAMDTFRREVIVDNRVIFYQFFRYAVSHYPLDSSFVLLLETWLSYIQPWRYSAHCNTKSLLRIEQEERNANTFISRSWFYFIVENFLVYTNVYYTLLKRLARADFTMPKHAYMLYRMTKVFAQPSLIEYILEIEAQWNEGSGWNSLLKQGITAMEKEDYNFVTFLAAEYKPLLSCLVQQMQRYICTLEKSLRNVDSDSSRKNHSFTDSIKEFFSSLTMDTTDKKGSYKTIQYLQYSFTYLKTIYERSELLKDCINEASTAFPADVSPIAELDSDDTVNSIARKTAWQSAITNKEVASFLKSEEDPDDQPVSSQEFAWLAHFLVFISTFFNLTFASDFSRLYYSTSFIGKLARHFINPPRYVYYFEKRRLPFGYSEKVSKLLPPRINLRWLANKRCTLYVIFLIFGFKIVRIPLMVAFFTWLIMYLTYVLIKTCVKPVPIIEAAS